jgi:predicted RNase H-like HicB family nuclease
MTHDRHYAILIEWSDEDDAYTVNFPEWEEQQHLIGYTHGVAYEVAARKGAEVLALLGQSARADGDPLPTPRRFDRRPALTAVRARPDRG